MPSLAPPERKKSTKPYDRISASPFVFLRVTWWMIPRRRQNMWIPKFKRDQKKGVESPIPTQVVSNEEIIPRPQSKKLKHVEHLIKESTGENATKFATTHPDFIRT